ncbi:HNH endonuclease [Komagataeibacter sp. FXV3]|uniref:HNH endonuclease n=1 Tax=Komagataeibacter sp. FXV3 TaxID=2608998 RepID=UPI00187B3117|nr:HNH endonuclease [Komagataeibacter sp. FXV3]MBE7730669.1 HNH endonuclease [Komagataeibacter sp. FXV3]
MNRDGFTSYPADENSHDKSNTPSETQQERKQRPEGLTLAEAINYHTDKKTGYWTASCDSDGYPHIWWEGKLRAVHRALATLAGWDIVGKVVMHIDDNPLHVRLENLRVGTQAENMADMAVKGRGVAGKANPRITPAEASVIIRQYDAGATIRQIAKDTFRSRGSIRNLIKRHQTATDDQNTAQAAFAFS